MEDLSKSTFFDERTIKFLGDLLRSPSVSCLSAVEKDFLRRRSDIIDLNEELDYQLIPKLSNYKNYVPVIDAVNFLLLGRDQNILESATSILEFAVREESVLTAKELAESLEEIENMPPGWVVNLLGVSNEKRHVAVEKNTNVSGLNLEAMRNFR